MGPPAATGVVRYFQVEERGSTVRTEVRGGVATWAVDVTRRRLDIGQVASSTAVVSAVLLVFTLMLADFFDTMATVVGVGAQGDLLDDDGQLPSAGPVLLVDSRAAVAGGAASASSSTTYIESAAGVGDGARTGLVSVVTGLLFLARRSSASCRTKPHRRRWSSSASC